MNLKNRTIAIVGLGYVGLPLAVEFGKKRTVIGFDISRDRINELQAGYDRTLEVPKEELKTARYLVFTSDAGSLRSSSHAKKKSISRESEKTTAISSEEPIIFIVTVPTPVDKAKNPDFTPLIKASETVGQALKVNDIVVYESTVYPGATEEVCVPILERESGLSLNTDFYVAYSPERINPGDKTHRLPDIKKVVSGSTLEVSEAISTFYQEIVTAGTYQASTIKVAEAAKVIENAQRDLNIAFVNELSLIFNRMGIDTTEVLEAAATKWNFIPFKPGLVGGHCIGVDPYYLTHKALELGYQSQVILSGRRINDNMGHYVAQSVIRLMLKSGINLSKASVGVLGITFKENCSDVRNSKVIDIIHELQQWGVRAKVVDPWANANEVHKEYGLQLTQLTANNSVDSIIVAVPHTEIAEITPDELRALCPNQIRPVIADLKAVYDRAALERVGFKVFRL